MTPAIPAVLIAGGAGRRLGGVCKPLLRLGDGRTLLARTRQVLAEAGCPAQALNADPAGPLAAADLPLIPDRRPGCGPLAGIEATLAWAQARGAAAVLILPGDLPALTPAVPAALLGGGGGDGDSAAALRVAWSRAPAERMHPLCALVPVALLPAISAVLDAGERAVHRCWQAHAAQAVWFPDAGPFANVNEPGDAVGLLGGGWEGGGGR